MSYFVLFEFYAILLWKKNFCFCFFCVICNILYPLSLPLSPDEYKSKVVCEDERMRLSCKRGMQIAVYSAMFGRTQQGTLECPLHHRRAPSVGEAPHHSHADGSDPQDS